MLACRTPPSRIPRVLSVAPLKLVRVVSVTVPAPAYSTRPKRGPIEARLPLVTIRGHGERIPRVLSVAPLKRLRSRLRSIEQRGIPRVLSVAPLKR